jgi:hypothetical protein
MIAGGLVGKKAVALQASGHFTARSFGLSATSQQYFSLRTNQHQPSTTSQTNMLLVGLQ